MAIHTVYGKKYKSIKSIANDYNVSISSINNYIKKGVPLEEALTKIKKSTISETVVKVRGNSFVTKKDCLQYYDIKENSAFVYMKRHSCSFEEAMEHLIDYREMKKGAD